MASEGPRRLCRQARRACLHGRRAGKYDGVYLPSYTIYTFAIIYPFVIPFVIYPRCLFISDDLVLFYLFVRLLILFNLILRLLIWQMLRASMWMPPTFQLRMWWVTNSFQPSWIRSWIRKHHLTLLGVWT